MKKLTTESVIDWWLEKYHNTNIEQVKKDHPEWTDQASSREFYSTYQVTQAQHDEWYNWIIKMVAKQNKISQEAAKRWFIWSYQNTAPIVKN